MIHELLRMYVCGLGLGLLAIAALLVLAPVCAFLLDVAPLLVLGVFMIGFMIFLNWLFGPDKK